MEHEPGPNRYTVGMAQRKRTKVESKPRPVSNPAGLTEDEADYIISERRLRENPEGGIAFEDYLKKHGLTMERPLRPDKPKTSLMSCLGQNPTSLRMPSP